MAAAMMELDEDLIEVLERLDAPVQRSARELMVLELYRRADISSGKAAELLGMKRMEFIDYATKLGIPFPSMTLEEWNQEAERIRRR